MRKITLILVAFVLLVTGFTVGAQAVILWENVCPSGFSVTQEPLANDGVLVKCVEQAPPTPTATVAPTATVVPPAENVTVNLNSNGITYTFTTNNGTTEPVTWIITNLSRTGMPFDLRGVWEGTAQVGDDDDVYEYAFRVGNNIYGTLGHGDETLLGLSLYVNGLPVQIARGQTLQGSNIVLIEDTRIGDGTIPNLATVKRQYKFSQQGLDLELTITWNTSVTMSYGYYAMFSVVDHPSVSTWGYTSAPFRLTSNDGSIKGVSLSESAFAWNEMNNRVVSLESIPYGNSIPVTRATFIQDSLEDNKIYFRVSAYTPQVGEVWHVNNRYRVSRGSHP